MPIVDLALHSVRLPRVYTTRVAPEGGHATGKDRSEYILLEVKSNTGVCGVGEISDIEPEWNTPDLETFTGLFRDLLIGAEWSQRHRLVERASDELPRDLHPEFRRLVLASIDIALLDLAAQSLGVPAWELLGGKRRRDLKVSWVAFIRTIDLLQTELEEKIAAGFRAFKLKVGEDFAEDCEKVRLCRQLVGPGAYIKIDASGHWQEAEAEEYLPRLAELGADAIETPLRLVSRKIAKNIPNVVNDDPETPALALARLRQRVPLAIIEHVADFEDRFALALARHNSVDAFNIVPVQAGSLSRCQRLAHVASVAGISVLLGSTVELGVATAAGLHLGVTFPETVLASDFVGPGLLAADVVTPPLTYCSGHLAPPEGSGLGLTLDRKALRRFA